MLLIFDANIWGEQAFWRTEIWQPKFLPLPVWSYPLMVSLQLSQFLSCSLTISLYLPFSLCLSWPFSVLSFVSSAFMLSPPSSPSSSASLFVSLQHRVQRWPTLSNRLMLASNTTQVIRLSCLLYSLTSSICPFPSPLSLSVCHISRHYDR